MGTPRLEAEPGDDARIDAGLRQAAEVPFDDVAVTEAVLSRIHATRGPAAGRGTRRRAGWLSWAGPAAFATVLMATPFVVAFYPASDDALLVGLALGDPRLVLTGAGPGPSLGRILE